jgi:hypothetical protein
METYGPEFSYEGMPVGLFKAGALPMADGSYGYEPYRGPGHLEMQEHLKATGSARCSYVAENQRVSFTVCACPKYGVLQLTAFKREPTSAP